VDVTIGKGRDKKTLTTHYRYCELLS
jgi:hypothetical protein